MKCKHNIPFWGIMLAIPVMIFGCRKAYNPPAINQFSNLLVVEGNIESGTDSTIIKVSHCQTFEPKGVKSRTKRAGGGRK